MLNSRLVYLWLFYLNVCFVFAEVKISVIYAPPEAANECRSIFILEK